jgi:hypothetical protein
MSESSTSTTTASSSRSDVEFKAWPKTPRLFRDMVITEKIDGTNAAVIVTEDFEVAAQSRNRLITPEADNFGFARWVQENGEELARTLGPGRHFGEWWGSGIQRGYGLTKGEKRFSLFNVSRYGAVDLSAVPGLSTVPVVYSGPFETESVRGAVETLRVRGSLASPGFDRPEGVIVFHTAAQQVYKVTLENDESPKSAA